MEIKEYTIFNEAEILHLYNSVGWSAYTVYPDVLRRGFERSLLTLGAYEAEQLVGIIRIVGDGHTIVFIQDILVLPDKQRQGVGSHLLQAVLKRFAHVRQIELATDDTPQSKAFYQSQGFAEMSDIGCCGFIKIG